MSVIETLVDNMLRDPKSSQGIFNLPCGYLEEPKDEMPVLHSEVHLREMSGDEEDLLGNPKIAFGQKMNALLASCIQRVGTITEKPKIQALVPSLLLGDRTFLFFAIRRVSLGDEFPFKEACPNCEETSVHPYNLANLHIRNMPDPMKRSYNETLPSRKVGNFRCISGREEAQREKLKKTLQPLSLQIYLRTIDIDGQPPNPIIIKQLSLRDRDHLRGRFAEIDGGVETTIQLSCPLCGHDFEQDLDPGQPSFFSPSETSVIWKRRSAT